MLFDVVKYIMFLDVGWYIMMHGVYMVSLARNPLCVSQYSKVYCPFVTITHCMPWYYTYKHVDHGHHGHSQVSKPIYFSPLILFMGECNLLKYLGKLWVARN